MKSLDYSRVPFFYFLFLRKKVVFFDKNIDGSAHLITDRLCTILKPFSKNKVALLRLIPFILFYLVFNPDSNFKTSALTVYSYVLGSVVFWRLYFSDNYEEIYAKKWIITLGLIIIGVLFYGVFIFISKMNFFNFGPIVMASLYICQKSICFLILSTVIYECINYKNQTWWIRDQQIFRESPILNQTLFSLALGLSLMFDIFFMIIF